MELSVANQNPKHLYSPFKNCTFTPFTVSYIDHVIFLPLSNVISSVRKNADISFITIGSRNNIGGINGINVDGSGTGNIGESVVILSNGMVLIWERTSNYGGYSTGNVLKRFFWKSRREGKVTCRIRKRKLKMEII